MRYMEDPRQAELFDSFQSILSPLAYNRLQHGWQHVFRCAILKLLPAKALGEHFDPTMGRPTKELYSIAGLLFIMEFRDWTHEQATDAYMFNVDLQYALNLKPENQSLCRRTLERYITLFRNDELAQELSGILERIGSSAENWWAKIEKLCKGRLLGRFFAASRARLREAAARLGAHHLANLAACPAR